MRDTTLLLSYKVLLSGMTQYEVHVGRIGPAGRDAQYFMGYYNSITGGYETFDTYFDLAAATAAFNQEQAQILQEEDKAHA